MATICASLEHPLSEDEVWGVAIAAHRSLCFKRLKKADKGTEQRAAAADMAAAFTITGRDLDDGLG